MPKAKKSAEPTAKRAPRSMKAAATEPMGTTAGTSPALEMKSAPANMEERIRARAYELFQSRNGQDGSPESDWRQAEAEVRADLDRTA